MNKRYMINSHLWLLMFSGFTAFKASKPCVDSELIQIPILSTNN